MRIQDEILKTLSNAGLECPVCGDRFDNKLYCGQISEDWSVPVLFCANCKYKLTLIMIENGRESNLLT